MPESRIIDVSYCHCCKVNTSENAIGNVTDFELDVPHCSVQWGNITNDNNATEINYPIAYTIFAKVIAVAGVSTQNLSNYSTTYGITIPGTVGLTYFTPIVGDTEYESKVSNNSKLGEWVAIGR